VVTADDFGAAEAVNEAVEQAHLRGVLTATSLMVGGPACADAVARARRLPSLRVGLHLVLVEAAPVSDPAVIPDLVGADGRFRNDMAAMGAEIFFRPAVQRQLEAEIAAQFAAYAATGLPLDHVNAHKHFHLHPTILSALLRIGQRFGMRALRAPVEPRAALALAEPQAALSAAWVSRPWAELAQHRMRREGLQVPDQVFGLRWSGAMSAQRLCGLIRHLPPGLSEIYLHPATADAYEGSAPGYCYLEEFRALVDPAVAAAARAEGVALGGYADFA
jgi:hopanoid biosynthesis associated protein HpnK